MAAPRARPVSDFLKQAGISAWSLVGLALVAWGLWKVLRHFKIIFPPLFVALIIIYMLNPLVSLLERRGVGRVAGSLLAYLTMVVVIAAVVIGLTPLISSEVGSISKQWPQLRRNIVASTQQLESYVQRKTGIIIDTEPFNCALGADRSGVSGAPDKQKCEQARSNLLDALSKKTSVITRFGFGAVEGFLLFIIGLIVALYLLIDLPTLQRNLLGLLPPGRRDEYASLGERLSRAVGGFFRGQLLVALVVGVLSAIGFRIIGLPFWLLLGSIAGFFNLIPFVGPFIGGGLGFLVGTFTGGVGLGLKAALVELIVQQIDNHLISPNVMSQTVELHPATVMLSILAGGSVGGLWGALLGIPAVAVAKILFLHVWTTRVDNGPGLISASDAEAESPTSDGDSGLHLP